MTHPEESQQPFYNNIRHFAARFMGNWDDADDVTQETYCRYFDSGQDLAPTQMQSYLYKTAYNIMIDILRRRKLINVYSSSGGEDDNYQSCLLDFRFKSPDEVTQTNEMGQLLWLKIKRFPPRVQEILYLRYVEDMKTKDIALIMDLQHSNVRKILSQTIVQLAAQMNEH